MPRRKFQSGAVLLCTAAAVAFAGLTHPASSTAQSGTPLLWTPTEYVLFDFVPVGGSSERAVTIVNGGDGPLTIQDLGITGPGVNDFRVGSDTCRGQAVAAGGGRCIVNVSFAPTSSGTKAGQLRITQASGCLNWINLAGSATGASAASVRAGAAGSDATAKAASQCPTALPPPAVVTNNTTTSASSTIVAPKATTCKSRRLVTVTFPKPKAGVTYKQFTALLNGKRIKTVSGSKLSTKVDLRGLPRGRFTLKLTLVPSTGRKVTKTKHYVTCVKS